MDFLDLTSYSPSSEPTPYTDPFENAYLADSYVPDYSFNGCDNDLFPDPICFPTSPNYWTPTPARDPYDSAAPSASTSPTTAFKPSPGTPGISSTWPDPRHAPFGTAGTLTTAFTRSQQGPLKVSTSPCLSPQSLTRRSPSSSTSDHSDASVSASASAPGTRPPPRKRGRPRLYRQSTGSSDGGGGGGGGTLEKAAYPARLPHNQVERKYREGLNMELERLRRAVPTLPQGDASAVMGAAKPSKAMVLAAAIEYIKRVEAERDEALLELERLRGGRKK